MSEITRRQAESARRWELGFGSDGILEVRVPLGATEMATRKTVPVTRAP